MATRAAALPVRGAAWRHFILPPSPDRLRVYRATRVAAFQLATDEDLRQLGLPPRRYLRADDSRFERTASFDAAFNRVLIYQSINLHSANIAPDFHPDDHPRTGRLTLNTFFDYDR